MAKLLDDALARRTHPTRPSKPAHAPCSPPGPARCTAKAPVFAAKSGPQSCPGQRAESRTFPNCKKLRYKHPETEASRLASSEASSPLPVTDKLAAFVYKRNIEIGGKGEDLSTAHVCHRRLQTLKLKHALARFMTSHTGASCTWGRSACFCRVFSKRECFCFLKSIHRKQSPAARPCFHPARGALASPRGRLRMSLSEPSLLPLRGSRCVGERSPFSAAISGGGGSRVPGRPMFHRS